MNPFSENDSEVEIFISNTERFIYNLKIGTGNNIHPDDRFGTKKKELAQFVRDFLSLEVEGLKICEKYELLWKSSSVHAINFLWTVIAYKVWT